MNESTGGVAAGTATVVKQKQPSEPSEAKHKLTAKFVAAVSVVAVAISGTMLLGGCSSELGNREPTFLGFSTTVAPDYSDLYAVLTGVNTRDLYPPGSGSEAQVDGIEEPDNMQTNGDQVFLISGDEVVIFAANGAGTREISRFLPSSCLSSPDFGRGQDTRRKFSTVDLIPYGHDTLVVIVGENYGNTSQTWSPRVWLGYHANDHTSAYLYDISDPTTPTCTGILGQSGELKEARLLGNILYLTTSYWVNTDRESFSADHPESFVPRLIDDNSVSIIPAADIAMSESPDSSVYTVVTAIDVATGARISQEAVLGISGYFYLSNDNVYLLENAEYPKPWGGTIPWCCCLGPREGPDTKPANQPKATSTTLVRISISDGDLRVAAVTSIPEVVYVAGEYGMNEYEGHLRIAANVVAYTEKLSYNSVLFIFDLQLRETARIDPLITRESIHAARFVGPVGYVVVNPGYEVPWDQQSDVLFTFDLRDPASPQVLSRFESPAYNSYLRLWGDSRLLGIGNDQVDFARTGDGSGATLSVFDVSDPRQITETQFLVLQKNRFGDSDYDHHSTLVSEANGLVGIAAHTCGMSDGFHRCHVDFHFFRDGEAGFQLAGTVQGAAENDSNTRAIMVGTNLYVWDTRSLQVVDADSFAVLASISLDRR